MAFLPSEDQRYIVHKGYSYREVIDGPRKGLIVSDWKLPEKQFDAESADILIIIPNGYPDVPPDMFHLFPWIRLSSSSAYPRCANVAVDFEKRKWQRWSRHNREWRPGIDGIWTMFKRVEKAIEIAA